MSLIIENVSCNIANNPVVKNLSLDLSAGNLSLLGPSGCGKTTLLRCIVGIQEISQGKINLFDQKLADQRQLLSLEQRQIGLIFQDYALFPHLTVAENIAYGISKHPNKQQLIEQHLELVQLQNYAKSYPHQLSGGQQQRVAIARSLVRKPSLLLLDEPFSNLDSKLRLELVHEIKELLIQQEIMSILVTHSKEEAFIFSDKIALMDQGEILQFGKNQDLYLHPKSKFIAEFLGPVNYLDITALEIDTIEFLGQQLCLMSPCHQVNGGYLESQQQYKLMIRPNQIQIVRNLVNNPAIPKFTVIDKSFHGSYFNYLVQHKDHPPIQVHSCLNISLQEQVELKFILEHGVFFKD